MEIKYYNQAFWIEYDLLIAKCVWSTRHLSAIAGIDNMSDITIDPEKQKLARQYARIRRRLMLVDLAIGAVYVFAWLL